ncbi:hypothetical protein AMS68_001066 [Peltaster fructicola]|uniref:Zn(2)-C6 fungal-type domain-containing protein n=1 Tax=Peltaster fructicola TaxID=286661 RepID=A0A6H0XLP2_9PEZI|nr:hypothetical protein AMS68_001066 [Peltaster fructicola]
MPGILPMKVIKIGSNAQTRIAQACDRCRSKKIRCDGIRPCCTQCANVGFECKTSDKLSRRAFPRGYTESLEERVRTLEAEVRELKDLLDEKDEKIDMLSRIHSFSTQPIQLPSPRRASESSLDLAKDDDHDYDEPDEIFKVRQSPYLRGEGSDSYFAGTSSARSLVESFQQRAKDQGYSVTTSTLLVDTTARLSADTPVVWSAPPRMLSDQLVNIYFQEWAPLFPVLHRPTFLTTYERFVADPEIISDRAELAHLNLVFAIASLSSSTGTDELSSMESQWRAALDAIMNDNTIETLQALVLAQMYCLQKGDLTQLLTYKGLSTTLSARLGLHQVQKSFSLNTLLSQTRKKLFWTLYTVDCFGSVVLGLPKHIKDDEVSCEYPVDADDEYVSEKGFQPTLPGESTKLSSALALFKATRILSRVLEEVFPAKASYELSLKRLADFSDELELWEATLPSHLRLSFAQDKPSTGTITSSSPILAFAYHYIRALIQRPAVSSKSLGSKASSSLMLHAASCKRIVQIMALLDERGLSFAFCLNKDEVLVLSGLGLLFQRMHLEAGSKMLKDNQKTLLTIATILDRVQSASSEPLKKLLLAFIPDLDLEAPTNSTSKSTKRSSKPSMSRNSSDRVNLPSPANDAQSSTRKQLKAIASRFSTSGKLHSQRVSVSSLDGLDLSINKPVRNNISESPVLSTGISLSPTSEPSLRLSMSNSPPDSVLADVYNPRSSKKRPTMPSVTNLDYLSFGNEPEQDLTSNRDSSQPIKPEPMPTDWEKLLGNLDNGTTNIFDACYGGPPIEALTDPLGLDCDRPLAIETNDAALALDARLLTLHDSKASNGSSRLSIPGSASSIWSNSSEEGGRRSSSSDALGSLVLSDLSIDWNLVLGEEWEDSLAASV